MRARFAAMLAVAGLITMSCGGIVDPSQNAVDTYSGAYPPGGQSAGQPFTASNGGELTVKITALSPNQSAYVGVTWAQANGDGSCGGSLGILAQNQFGQLNVPAISGARIVSGKYCIIMSDSVGVTQTKTFTATISHP